MNIEQMKKDWQEHCKEYGFEGFFISRNTGFVLMSNNIENNTQVYSGNKIEYFKSNEAMYLHCKDTENLDNYKLFTIFYEKLMEQK